MCTPGNRPAQITAKIVMASAARFTPVRQFWRVRKRMAEMSVPAWPMPTQNTKFTMGQPQYTGLLLPQTPTPVVIRYRRQIPSSPAATGRPEGGDPGLVRVLGRGHLRDASATASVTVPKRRVVAFHQGRPDGGDRRGAFERRRRRRMRDQWSSWQCSFVVVGGPVLGVV